MINGEKIKELRTKLGKTQYQLAQKALVSEPYISYLESGKKTNPSLEVLVLIAEGLNVPVDELLKRRRTI